MTSRNVDLKHQLILFSFPKPRLFTLHLMRKDIFDSRCLVSKETFPPFFPSQFTADLLRTIYVLQAAGDRIPFVFYFSALPPFFPPICVCICVRACFRRTRAEIASLVSRPLIKLYFFPLLPSTSFLLKKKCFILFSFPPHFVQTALPLKRSRVSFNWLCSASYVRVQKE